MDPLPSQFLRTRRLATALLVAMAVVFIIAHALRGQHPAWALLRAFAEAALVGGLADWFAVTALFRRPLGLPIPHTAIIPANKDRLADGIAEFLQQNFLSRRVLEAQLAPLDFAAFIAAALGDARLRGWLAQRSQSFAGQLSPGALVAGWLHAQLQAQQHQQWFDRMANGARWLLEQHHAEVYQKVCEKSPRWMPRRVNDELYQRLMDGLTELIDAMRLPDSAARAQFAQFLADEAAHWADGRHDATITAALQPSAAGEPGLLAGHLDAAMARFAEQLDADPEQRAALNRWLRRQSVRLLVRRRAAIVGLVRRVIGGWDAQTVAGRIEARVGRDLQFIRISGTLVGGAVGLLIHLSFILF